MSIPKIVAEQEAEAERLHQEAYGKQGDVPAEDTPPAEEVAEEPEEEAAAEPEAKAEKVEDTPPQKVAPPAKEPSTDFSAEYKTLQGKYNAEVPRLYEQIRSLEKELSQAKEQMAGWNKASNSPDKSKESQKAEAPEDISGVYAKLSEDYGQEFANGLKKIIANEIRASITDISKSVDPVKARIEEVHQAVQRTAEERFHDELTKIVPDWKQVYHDPGFATFLGQIDPMSGVSLRDLAIDANTKHDAPRLARFYERYKSTTQPKESPAEQATEDSSTDEKEKLVAPSANKRSVQSGQPNKADYIRDVDITKFYGDVARGKYKDRPKAEEAMEAKINRAIAQGMVVAASR